MPDGPAPARTVIGGPGLSAAGDDLAEVSARFGAALREAGLPVGPGRCERFAAAVTVARPATPRALYLCALATLVSSRDHAVILRAVFDQVFSGRSSRYSSVNRSASRGVSPRASASLMASSCRG